MASQTVTLNVPEGLFDRLRRRARDANRTVEAELLEVLAAAVPSADELPADLVEAVAALELLDDAALWAAARTRLADAAAGQLEELHLRRQREGLTEAEDRKRAELVRQSERVLLVRARAAALLRQRGHDVSGLSGP
jgi:plasmid stability protein